MSCPAVIDPTGADIHGEAARLREHGPLVEVELPQGVPAWIVLSHELAARLLTDTRIRKDPTKHWTAFRNGEIRSDWPLASWVAMRNMTTTDDEDHARLRRPVMRTFTHRRVQAMRPTIEATVNHLLDGLAIAAQNGPVDLKAAYTYPLPTSIICDLFGIPVEERANLLEPGEVTIDSSTSPEDAEQNLRHWNTLFRQFLDTKRAGDADDLTTALLTTTDDQGRTLSDDELAGTLLLMLGAGSETVTNLVSNAVFNLLTHPDQLALLLDGQASWGDVIDETLRQQCPVNMLPMRFAATDIDIAGTTIHQGDALLVGYAATGRDPEQHGDTATTWDITRPSKISLGFGRGDHYCLGAPLARLESQIALSHLFARFPAIELAGRPTQLRPQGTFILNGFAALPVTVQP